MSEVNSHELDLDLIIFKGCFAYLDDTETITKTKGFTKFYRFNEMSKNCQKSMNDKVKFI